MNKRIPLLMRALILCCLIWNVGCREDRGDGLNVLPAIDVPSPPTPRQDRPLSAPHPIGRPIEAEESMEIITDVMVNAGCESWATQVAVAKGHAEPALCEHVIMNALVEQDGDLYEIGTPFMWVVGDPNVADLACQSGPHDNFCWPIGQRDIFDQDTFTEPTTLMMACAMNHCPETNETCQDLVCGSVSVTSVVNLEGSWVVESTLLEDAWALEIVQDGRRLTGATLNLKHGVIQDMLVSFELDDALYRGGIGLDRAHMSGEIYDLMTLEYIGEWSAARLP